MEWVTTTLFCNGAETSYFGMENVKKKAIPMKTLNDIEMRNTILIKRKLRSAKTFESVVNYWPLWLLVEPTE
jgi:NADH dehydrogenase FAD-containing subunit